ncbi:MAG: hypothetical protein JWM80_6395 [Cyanobacteria bacterium RYN_339]|nr:hypothetical protein [Cyanobacteria bacterium RYN_339]
MFRPLIPLVLVTALFTGACHLGAPTKPTVPQSRIGVDTIGQGRTTLAVRMLAQGTFTLPATLISVGSGGLVSTGSGSLVSTGSGSLVSTGTGHYRVQAVAEQPVGNAPVALLTGAGAATGVTTTSDPGGRFFLTGSTSGGVYRLEACHGDARYLTLVAVGATAPAESPLNLATTLVATRLLAEHPDGLAVLEMDAFARTVVAVQDALTDADIPAGWSPEACLAGLEAAHPAVKAAIGSFKSQQQALESRAKDIQFKVQALASELKMPQEQVSGAMMAALSSHPGATDEEITHQVRQEAPPASAPASGGSSGGSAGSSAASQPNGQATTGPTGQATTSPTGQPATSPTGQPTTGPTGQATTSPTGQPTTSPTGQATTSPTGQATTSPTGQATTSPTGQATATPTPRPTATPVPHASTSPQPTPTPVPQATPTHTPAPAATTTPAPVSTPTPTPRPTATPAPVATPTPSPSQLPAGPWKTWDEYWDDYDKKHHTNHGKDTDGNNGKGNDD